MDVLIKPIITEKATLGSELSNCYSFLVHTRANKVEIKKAVEAAYGGICRESENTQLRTFKKNKIHQNRYPIRQN